MSFVNPLLLATALAVPFGYRICTTAALVFKACAQCLVNCELIIFPLMQGRYFLLMCRILSFNVWLSIESQSVIAIATEGVKFILASVSLPTHHHTTPQIDCTINRPHQCVEVDCSDINIIPLQLIPNKIRIPHSANSTDTSTLTGQYQY